MSMPAERVHPAMTLAELLRGIADAPEIPVYDIHSDSRKLQAGDVFLACQGISSHGIDYVDTAIAAGAAAIVYDASTAAAPEFVPGIPIIAVDNLGKHLGTIANRFFASPSASMRVIGITGTNGKTTVAWLIAQCMQRLGESCAYIGTLGAGIGTVDLNASMTTPATIELNSQLAGFRDAGATFAALEVSSHALAQNRVDGVAFDTVMFTNLGRDHLDYHGDMQSYGDAKARLFSEYSAKQRIINLDSEFGTRLADRCGQDVVTVSTKFDRVANGRPYVFVRAVVANALGSQVKVVSSWGEATMALPLVGDFNVANAVMVLALLLTQGVPMQQACAVLGDVTAPPGRMQRVPAAASAPTVYVDFAHTPDALDVVLRALRTHCRGKLWCVFGCGGDRDTGKRPLMGRIVEHRADRVVISSDNPRSENPAKIIAAIVAGLQRPAAAVVIEDRATAIAWTIAQASADDVVLIAGKGHENNQSDLALASANLALRPVATQ
ncbi:MAG: UDP-N-acetylmuramoyl-L-alanyl-D-glutamate--2,6-diaminopimelate ligase [Gammaproteobacteria bacterium]|nr:UDP-N-acetylmuramoyl-L-alanyl-D-glutamate--2,6-diaminopimelate ligase [Gammaproteobacteria bacterium]MDH5303454.1 UDP-N-acetylmuramoyl-L-alanyl-D-glutamate--2,6-diaminopimelate ligase [Gammaproteobacteria bacterium]MDH5321809.1 UDP-N-acetylmuramoyl-L-alanyl-D-glutamate--2,6-diaminopimelate ligase [Gammaproteobacteria bacterium]